MRDRSSSAPTLRVGVHAFACACLLVGCGRDKGPAIAKVTGTVTRAGKPVADLQVHFVPEHGRPSWGLTDARGRFKLYYTQEEDGAVFGEHTIYVVFNSTQPQSFAGEGTNAKGPYLEAKVDEPGSPSNPTPPPELTADDRRTITEKYGNRTTSPLRATIEKNGQEIGLELD